MANDSFTSKLGYSSTSQLENISFLDVTESLNKNSFRSFLHKAGGADKNQRNLPQLPVLMKKTDGNIEAAEIYACHSRLDGENVIEIQLVTVGDLKLSNRIFNLPWKLYLAMLFLAFFATVPALFLIKLNINNAPQVYLPTDAPAVITDNQLREIFPSDQGIILLFEGVALYSEGFMEALDNLTKALENHPKIEKVVSVTSQDHIKASEGGFLIEPLISTDDIDNLSAAQRKQKILGDRFAHKLLVARDSSALGVLIIPDAINNSFGRMSLQEEILKIVRDNRLSGYLSAMAGQITTDVEQTRSLLRENLIFIPTTLGIGLILIWLLFNRIFAVVISGIVISTAVSSTVAFYVLFDKPFNMISSILPPLLSALSIAALIHLFTALQLASKSGLHGKARVETALSIVRSPALYTSLTTIAGFASLALSTIPPIQSFGLITAAGVGLIYFVVYHIVPHIFIQYDTAQWPSKPAKKNLLDTIVGVLFHTGTRHPGKTLLVIVTAICLAAPSLTRIVVETNLQEFFAKTHKTRLANEYISDKLVGTTPLDISLKSDEPEELLTPENLLWMREFQKWAESQPEIDKTISVADFIEEMHWGFNEGKPDFRKIPDDPELISQYVFIYDGNDLFDFIDESFQRSHISLNLNVSGANEISRVIDRIRAYIDTHQSEMGVDIAGYGRMFAEQEDLLVEGQLKSMLGAIGLIFLFMLIQWRSFRDAIICMLPNLAPVLLMFIIMGGFGIWLDMATAMIASVTLGIAIDDTIHLYHGFIRRVRKNINPTLALARTYRHAGKAVVTTTIILCAQFLILAFGQFVPISNFGILTCVGLLAALLFDLLVLPAILVIVFARKPQRLKIS